MNTQETVKVHLDIIRGLLANHKTVESQYIEKFFLIGLDLGQACAQRDQLIKEIEFLKLQTLSKMDVKND